MLVDDARAELHKIKTVCQTASPTQELGDLLVIQHPYAGPWAIAGGFLRDQLLRKPAKDLDVFLVEDPLVDYYGMASKIAVLYAGRITNIIGGYKEWSEDVALVYQIAVAPGYQFTSIDLIVMKADAGITEEQFVRLMCDRVDLRLNAIGCGMATTDQHPAWMDDVRAKRLVVQASRVNPEDRPRQQRRLDRLAGPGGKFEGWTVWEEQVDGTLVPWDR